MCFKEGRLYKSKNVEKSFLQIKIDFQEIKTSQKINVFFELF